MNLTPEQELENAQIKVNYFKICRFLEFTQEEAMHPNAGNWIIDFIKQGQTSLSLLKSMKLRSNENQNVENYNKSDVITEAIVNSPLDK